jgi:hypothetical protein
MAICANLALSRARQEAEQVAHGRNCCRFWRSVEHRSKPVKRLARYMIAQRLAAPDPF